jgi:hypothetical protein
LFIHNAECVQHVDSEDDTTAADPYLELVNALTTERVMTKQSTDDTDADDSEFGACASLVLSWRTRVQIDN